MIRQVYSYRIGKKVYGLSDADCVVIKPMAIRMTDGISKIRV